MCICVQINLNVFIYLSYEKIHLLELSNSSVEKKYCFQWTYQKPLF